MCPDFVHCLNWGFPYVLAWEKEPTGVDERLPSSSSEHDKVGDGGFCSCVCSILDSCLPDGLGERVVRVGEHVTDIAGLPVFFFGISFITIFRTSVGSSWWGERDRALGRE